MLKLREKLNKEAPKRVFDFPTRHEKLTEFTVVYDLTVDKQELGMKLVF